MTGEISGSEPCLERRYADAADGFTFVLSRGQESVESVILDNANADREVKLSDGIERFGDPEHAALCEGELLRKESPSLENWLK